MKMSHLYLSKSSINGLGLYTSRSIDIGDMVGVIHGKIEHIKQWTPYLSRMGKNWIGVGRFTWINTAESPFRYINHSCEPNAFIVGKRTVVALREIPAGTEVTMDYSFTESDPGWSIKCHCQSGSCRKHIGPVDTLSSNYFQEVSHLIPRNFAKIYSLNQRSAKSDR